MKKLLLLLIVVGIIAVVVLNNQEPSEDKDTPRRDVSRIDQGLGITPGPGMELP